MRLRASGRLLRWGAVALLCPALLAAAAPAAHAHGRGTEATNYASRVTDAPAIPGVSWAIHGGDEFLEVTNTSDVEVLVYGYDGEPYLRVGPDGVLANRRSPAAYLNEDQFGRVEVPEHADPDAPPEWERVAGRPSHAWHDHRIHYMSPTPPPEIAANPDVEQVVPGFERWEVPFRHGDEEHVVAGELRWVPGPSPWPWLGIALAPAALALLGLASRPERHARERRWPGLVRPAALVLAAVVALNLPRLVDDLLAVPLPATVAAFAALQTALFLAIGAFGALRAWQAGDGAFTALGVGSAAVLIGQGVLAAPVLTASQLASLLPDAAVRLIVAVSLVQALPVGVVAVIGTRRLLPRAADAHQPAGSAP